MAAGTEAGGDWAQEAARSIAAAAAEPTRLRVDLDQRAVRVLEGPNEVLGVDLDDFAGRNIETLPIAFGERYGACDVSAPLVEHPDVRR